MKGLELSRLYYEEFGAKMISEQFPDFKDRIATGLCGEGSECFGYDDDVSRDHDFGPKFCMWLTDDDYYIIGDALRRAYDSLPVKFMGFDRSVNSFHDGGRHGVIPISQFYVNYTGTKKGPSTLDEWFRIPTYFLAACTNGEVFSDPLGEFSAIRNHILHDMPEDIRKKRIAALAFEMAQSGQYNYGRLIRHNEPGAAVIALSRFVQAAAKMIYLLNRKHCPYYKWMLRGIRDLPELSHTYEMLSSLLCSPEDPSLKEEKIEKVCASVLGELKKQGYTFIDSGFLEPVALSIHESIRDLRLRSVHVSVEN